MRKGVAEIEGCPQSVHFPEILFDDIGFGKSAFFDCFAQEWLLQVGDITEMELQKTEKWFVLLD